MDVKNQKAKGLYLATLLLCLLLTAPALAAGAKGVYYGSADLYSTRYPGMTYQDSYYCQDEWFQRDPSERNDSLALLSMQLTAAAVTANTKGLGGNFLRKLGFDQVGVSKGFSSSDPDDCAFTWGKKTIMGEGGSSTLVAIVVQSYSFDPKIKLKGWLQNFLINRGSYQGEHGSFALAAEKVLGEVTALSDGGDVTYWIMGQSRGGALASILAKKLPEVMPSLEGHIYAYTFESPTTVDIKALGNNKRYEYIHNYLCSDDLVTMIPPWGMTRYGVTHDLKTSKTDGGLETELSKMGFLAQLPDFEQGEDTKSRAETIVKVLLSRIPTRKDYSAKQKDQFTDVQGTKRTITYSYQEKLGNLMTLIFGRGIALRTDSGDLMSKVADLYPIEQLLAKALRNGKDADYYEAARLFNPVAAKLVQGWNLKTEDTYVLFKLLGPLLVDSSYVPTGSQSDDAILYLSPLITLVANKDKLILSHHFETIIARLKALSPEPSLGDISISVSKPTAGEAIDLMPGRVKKAVRKLSLPGVWADSSWILNSRALPENETAYLKVELHVSGQQVPEGLQFLINGKSPASPLQVSRGSGEYLLEGMWMFTLGKPDMVTIRFHEDEHGMEVPKPIKVKRGTVLKATKQPVDYGIVTIKGEKWRFNGWAQQKDEKYVFYQDLTAREDLDLYQNWTRLIDQIEISFEIPQAGGKIKAPAVTDPRKGYYVANDWEIMDSTFSRVNKLEANKEYILSFTLAMNPSEKQEFWTKKGDTGDLQYLGKVLVNGKEAEVSVSKGTLQCSFTFSPTAVKEKVPKPETPLSPGAKAKDAKRLLATMTLDQDMDGSSYLPLQLLSENQIEDSIHLRWKKVPSATTYLVYGAKCGVGKRMMELANVKGNTYTVKKAGDLLQPGKYYKFLVLALDQKEKVVSVSKMIHVSTSGNPLNQNAAALKIQVREDKAWKEAKSLKLKVGETLPLKGAMEKKDAAGKIDQHVAIRYASSDSSVAEVLLDGSISAKKKGTAQIYAYAQNGIYVKLKVTVE